MDWVRWAGGSCVPHKAPAVAGGVEAWGFPPPRTDPHLADQAADMPGWRRPQEPVSGSVVPGVGRNRQNHAGRDKARGSA